MFVQHEYDYESWPWYEKSFGMNSKKL
jgi:hypothetical protein